MNAAEATPATTMTAPTITPRHNMRPAIHSHRFAPRGTAKRMRALRAVTWVTLVTMVAELVVGYWSGSLALTADGWHMGTHALALGGAVLAYALSHRARKQAHYAFGGWKIEVLGAYSSGALLAAVSAMLVWDSIDTLRHPHAIAYGEALAVTSLGLLVNLVSAWWLHRGNKPVAGTAAGQASGDAHATHDAHAHHHGHSHDAGHAHHHDHGHPQGHQHDHHDHGHSHDHVHGHSHHHGHGHDHNFNAAFVHVVADALTSVAALAALLGGKIWGLAWLDPAVALLGAALIVQWAWSVMRQSATALIDATNDPALALQVRQHIEADGDARVGDLHLWQVGSNAWAVALSVVADAPQSPDAYRALLKPLRQLKHVTIEVHRCADPACGEAASAA